MITEKEQAFKDAVDASNGDSLDDEAAYDDAIEAAVEGSLADIYVDVGLLIEQSGEEVDESALQALRSTGIEPREATAVASVIPGSDQVEVEISSDLGDQEAPSGDRLRAAGVAAGELVRRRRGLRLWWAAGRSARRTRQAGDSGPGPPGSAEERPEQCRRQSRHHRRLDSQWRYFRRRHQREKPRRRLGAGHRQQETGIRHRLQHRLVVAARRFPGRTLGDRRRQGLFDQHRRTSAAACGFDEGRSDRDRLGLPAADEALTSDTTLAETQAFKDAETALGSIPISFFVDGPEALRLAESLVPRSETGFQEAKPYLKKISSIALGSNADGDRVTAKLIISLEK